MPAIKKAFDLMGDDILDLSTENKALKNQIGEYDEKWLQGSKAKFLKQIDDEKRAILIMSRMNKTDGKHKKMAFIPYNKLWESEFDKIVFKKDKNKTRFNYYSIITRSTRYL